VAYMCWAYRRRGVVLDVNGEAVEWLYQEPEETFEYSSAAAAEPALIDLAGAAPGTKIVHLKTPLTDAAVRGRKGGDVVLLSGTVFTGRDAVHKYLYKGGELDVLKNAVIYHCGPVVMEEPDKPYRIAAAGPTTSIREEPYQDKIIEKYGIKAVIGKGGMGVKTLAACQAHGCVYLHAIGGAAQIFAHCVERVENGYLKQFGSPEAVRELDVSNFPAVVRMDAHGTSLHQAVEAESKKKLQAVLA